MAVSTFVCSANVIECCLKFIREKTWDSKFTRVPRFSGFPTNLAVIQFRLVAPNTNHITLTLQWIESSNLIDNSNNSERHSASCSKNWRDRSRSKQNVSARMKKNTKISENTGRDGGEGGQVLANILVTERGTKTHQYRRMCAVTHLSGQLGKLFLGVWNKNYVV